MASEFVTVVNGSAGMIIGAFVIARRDACALAVRDLCAIPAHWSPVVARAVAGTGLAILTAGSWTVHLVFGR